MGGFYTGSLETYLVDLELNRVDLVKEGSNSKAHILLNKGKEQSNMPKTYEELVAMLKPEEADVLKAHVDEIEKSANEKVCAKEDELKLKDEELAKAKEDNEALTNKVSEIEKAKSEATEEEILKSAPPALQEMIAKVRQQNAELVEREADAIAKTRFEELKAIPCDETELKGILKSASPAVFEVLKKAAVAIEATVLNKGMTGTKGAESTIGGAFSKLEKAAKELQEVNKSLTYEQAFTQVMKDKPELYAEYTKEEVN